MRNPYDVRTPRRQQPALPTRKRSLGMSAGALGIGLLGGYGLMASRSCAAPPDPQSPEALAMPAESLQKLNDEYQQCRRRRTSTTSRTRRSFASNWGSSRSSVSRGGFGRSGSFGG